VKQRGEKSATGLIIMPSIMKYLGKVLYRWMSWTSEVTAWIHKHEMQ
jgi:hypothetical protein